MRDEGAVQHLRNAIQTIELLRQDVDPLGVLAVEPEDLAALQRRLESALTRVQQVRDFLLESPRDSFTTDSHHADYVETGRRLH